MSMPTITVCVDGRPLGPGEVAFEFQTDPYPGGHRYEVRIERDAIDDEIWGFAKFQSASPPTEDQARHWFFWLFHILSRHKDAQLAKEMPFVLNNIDEFQMSSNQILFLGDCSEFVRPPASVD